jgi:hypothetical protein
MRRRSGLSIALIFKLTHYRLPKPGQHVVPNGKKWSARPFLALGFGALAGA